MVSDKTDYGSFAEPSSSVIIGGGGGESAGRVANSSGNLHSLVNHSNSRHTSESSDSNSGISSGASVLDSDQVVSGSQVSIDSNARNRPNSNTLHHASLNLDLSHNNSGRTISSPTIDDTTQRSGTDDGTARGARIRISTNRYRNSSGNNNTLNPTNSQSAPRLSPTETIVIISNHGGGGKTSNNANGTTITHIYSNSSSPMSTNSGDLLYQRQPLLQECENGWIDHDGDAELDSPVSSDGKRGRTAVRIDIPSDQSVVTLKYPKEKRKTVIAFLVLSCNFVLATLSLALTHERVPDRNIYKPLPDIILDNVTAQDWALSVSDVLVAISTLATAVVMLLHRHRWIVFRRAFLILACLYFMRSITIYVTVLPVASYTYHCSPKSNSTSVLEILRRVIQLVSGFGLSINGQHTYCGDYIYSGHTVILCIAYLFIQEYTPRKLFYLHWASWIVSIVGVVMMLISRGHYTVDVLIAYYVATRIFWIYHTLANNPQLKVQNGQNGSTTNFLSRIWWFPIFRYMEGNVGGPLPRQYSLPWFSSREQRARRSI
ncbi:phosphatidylcholine:ceramide cholinephosphotransferase 2 [Folsomia candida]|uniref:phosphatidylcholine:ceramide cholinephosphotransferase 2 n=1 Tax=Folsomia candida TaxID=158441 RepID=UPI000B8FAF57|nr:phosphatidylcholine:ceramide cholinephosphotransferase 2 [Folsomia candida]